MKSISFASAKSASGFAPRSSKNTRVSSRLNTSCRAPLSLSLMSLGVAAGTSATSHGEKVTFGGVVHGRDLWPVKADISQFEQVIVNLAVNARDAMPDGGTLSIRTANVEAKDAGALGAKGMPSGDYVMVEVSDTGTGIPPDIIDKIFEPFFTTKEVGKGTGLGLSMSYEIVTKGHGGELKVETEVGQGTTFIIVLPNAIINEDSRS